MARIIKEFGFQIPVDLKVPPDKDWKLGDIIYVEPGKRPYFVGWYNELFRQSGGCSCCGNRPHITVPYDVVIKYLDDPWEHYRDLALKKFPEEGACRLTLHLRDKLSSFIPGINNIYEEHGWVSARLNYSWGIFSNLTIDFGSGLIQIFKSPNITKILNFYYENIFHNRISFYFSYDKRGVSHIISMPSSWGYAIVFSEGNNRYMRTLRIIGPVNSLEEVVEKLKEHFQKSIVLKFNDFKLYKAIKDVE